MSSANARYVEEPVLQSRRKEDVARTQLGPVEKFEAKRLVSARVGARNLVDQDELGVEAASLLVRPLHPFQPTNAGSGTPG